MKLQKVLLLLTLIFMVLMVSPLHAQTADEILADGRGEAVVVISETAINVYTVIIGGLVTLVGIITLTALRFVYKSTPEWLHSTVLAIADKVITALENASVDTKTQIDDKISGAVRDAFDRFINLLGVIEVVDTDDDTPPAPAPSDTPVQ